VAICEHLAWARSARLGEIALRPTMKHLAWTRLWAEQTRFSSRTRLGESPSPERDNASLKTRALRLGELL